MCFSPKTRLHVCSLAVGCWNNKESEVRIEGYALRVSSNYWWSKCLWNNKGNRHHSSHRMDNKYQKIPLKIALQNMTLYSILLALTTGKMLIKNLTISSKNYMRSCKSMVTLLLTNTLISITRPIILTHKFCKRVSVATCVQEYGAADKTAMEVESDDGNDDDKENESDVSQISHKNRWICSIS